MGPGLRSRGLSVQAKYRVLVVGGDARTSSEVLLRKVLNL